MLHDIRVAIAIPTWVGLAFLTMAAGVFGAPRNLDAHPFVVDQANTPMINGSVSVLFLSPIGQEFTPAVPSLDVVELHLANSASSGIPMVADLFVNIRIGT